MRANELKGLGVVALSKAEKIGEVDDVLFDAEFRQVLGFRVKKEGLFSRTEALPRGSVTSIGPDAVTVASPDVINQQERFAELAHAATLNQVEQTKVVTEAGELLGTISHLEIDDDARTVTAYTLASSLIDRVMGHDEAFVKADEVIRLGEGGIMVVPNTVGTRLQAPPQ
ncbi:MAG: PRC-barrel domain-containing protein [Chloroflexota bacterium]|nr:PRC-barrel domain-containing protein [Chloroflexota bacterium]